MFDLKAGNETLTLKGHDGAVSAIAWSPDGKRVLTGSEDRTARLWDLATGRVLLTLKGHNAGVTAVAWSPNGLHIVTGSKDKTARVWSADSNVGR